MDWLKVVFYAGVVSGFAVLILGVMAIAKKVKWWLPLVVAIPAVFCAIVFFSLAQGK